MNYKTDQQQRKLHVNHLFFEKSKKTGNPRNTNKKKAREKNRPLIFRMRDNAIYNIDIKRIIKGHFINLHLRKRN